MGVLLYNVILIVSLPLTLSFFVFRMLLWPEDRLGIFERFGRWPGPWDKRNPDKVRLWVHAASIGEVMAAMPLIDRWLGLRPEWEIILSVMTRSGRRLAEQRLGDRVRIHYFPIDLPGLAAGLLDRAAPNLILLVETELWPNFLQAASQRGIPVLLINGRISPRSYPRYRAVRWFLGETMRRIRMYCMQTEQDARRIISLGAPPERVRVLGNLKFDQSVFPIPDDGRRTLLKQMGWGANDRVLVAGSTHEKEETMLLTVYDRVKVKVPDFRLILAPRHLNRIPGLTALLSSPGRRCRRYSELGAGGVEADILLVDIMGKLGSLYSLGSVVFVGGSLVPVGGHNLLEPAGQGRPVLFGPFIQHVSESAELLLTSGGGLMVRDLDELTLQVETLMLDPERQRQMAARAREIVIRHRGASDRTREIVEREITMGAMNTFDRLDFRAAVERWFKDCLLVSRGGFLTSLAAVILGGLSLPYQVWQEVRVRAYSSGLLRSVRLERPVISVGNLTLGGTGKTPTVMALCRLLQKNGRRPAVLTRGYGGRTSDSVRVVVGNADPDQKTDGLGDEPCLMAEHMPGVPILVSTDRPAAGRLALEKYQADVLVLDDGYQHLRLRRDLNLLIMDTLQPIGNRHVFPRGLLRESERQVRRADAVLLTHVEDPAGTEQLKAFVRSHRPELPVFTSRHRIVDLIHLGSGRIASVETLRKRRLMAVSGIGQPDRFFRSLQEYGAQLSLGCVFPDHHRYSMKDMDRLEAESARLETGMIITTEKDAVRIKELGRSIELWWAARLELLIQEAEAFEALVMRVLK